MTELPSNILKNLSSALNYLKSDSSSLVSTAASKLHTEYFPIELKQTPEPIAFRLNSQDVHDSSTRLIQYPTSPDGLVFALVDHSIIVEIENESNWRARVLAIQKLESALDELEELNKITPYLAMFLRLIAKLIKDKNFKVSETALMISEKLVKSRELRNVANFALIVPACIEKLGDNKISIRMSSFRVLRGLLGILRSNFLIPSLYQSLESQNWHIKEESTNLLITAILQNVEFEYSEIIEPLAKLLEDPRPKVRNVSVEGFAVLKTKIQGLEDSLQHLLDKDLYETLKTRLMNPSTAMLTEDYLEYPKLPLIKTNRVQETSEIRDEIFSARIEIPSKTQEMSVTNMRPTSQIKHIQPVAKSYNYLPRRLSPVSIKPESESFYLQDEQILPLKNPHEHLQRLFNREDSWEQHFEAINILRRLTKHHQEVFFSKVTLHNIILDVVKWADSLRSSLSKNALLLLQDMCLKLGKSMDSEISELLKILIKKAIDTNTFISEQAISTLEAMLTGLSEHKIMPLIIFHCQNTKNPQIKAQLSFCFGRIFRKSKENVGKIRDIERSLQILAEYLTDGNSDVRKSAQDSFEELFKSIRSEIVLDTLLIRSLKDSLYQKVQRIFAKVSRSQSPQKSRSDSRLSKISFKLRRNFPKFVIKKSEEDLSEIYLKAQDSDWKTRFDSISKIAEVSKTKNFSLIQTEKIVNTLCIGMSDVNTKVQIHSLMTLKKVILVLKSLINPCISQLLREICKVLNMQNSNLRALGSEILSLFAQYCDVDVLIASILVVLSECKSRVRITLLKFISVQIKSVNEEDLRLLVQVLCENVEFPRQEVRTEAEKCMICLFEFIKEKIFQFVPIDKMETVKQVLDNN